MAIDTECKACGKALRARDDAAGKRMTCPDCGTEITVPSLLSASDVFETSASKVFENSSPKSIPADVQGDDRERQPCPDCGELIIPTAATCRFCGYSLKNKRPEGMRPRKTPGKGKSDSDDHRRFRREMMVLGIISVLLSLVMLAASSNLSQKAKQAGPVVEQFLADLVGQLFLAGVIWMVVAVGGFLKKV